MPKIIFTSRLDDDCSLGAYLLCQIAPDLAQKHPEIQIEIIGGGSEYPKISQIAHQINQKLNQRLIFCRGSTSNPQQFYEKDSLFVGVSRAALEAMARGLPAVLLGNEGYFGLCNKTNLRAAIKTNLTCRHARHTQPVCTSDELFCEIDCYLSLPESEKNALSNLSREVIARYFSAKKMARDTLEVYREAIKKASPEGLAK